jgi:hypothetical protein
MYYTSPYPHNKHSYTNIKPQLFSLSVQITTHHANKTDCGVGVAAVVNSCCVVLVVVGVAASKCANTVS